MLQMIQLRILSLPCELRCGSMLMILPNLMAMTYPVVPPLFHKVIAGILILSEIVDNNECVRKLWNSGHQELHSPQGEDSGATSGGASDFATDESFSFHA